MLVTLKEILAEAEKRQVAIGAFNAAGLECLQAIIEAAEELDLPVIIQFAQCHECYNHIEEMAPIILQFAKQAKVPVCAHLDHGEDLEYVQKALELGFTGVMYDGSTLSYEENVKNTKAAVALAAKYGASVEAELGCMGRKETGAGNHTGEEDDTKIYTDPTQAKAFVAETGIDALACSFGTTHGIYLTKPKLDFSVVENVRQETENIPVVMHGGSGVSKEDFHAAVEAGVRKINYFTYMDKAAGEAMKEYLDSLTAGKPAFFTDATLVIRKAMKENIMQAMKTFARME